MKTLKQIVETISVNPAISKLTPVVKVDEILKKLGFKNKHPHILDVDSVKSGYALSHYELRQKDVPGLVFTVELTYDVRTPVIDKDLDLGFRWEGKMYTQRDRRFSDKAVSIFRWAARIVKLLENSRYQGLDFGGCISQR